MRRMNGLRRLLLLGTAATLAAPALASSRRALVTMTDGPFYPPSAWRAAWADQDADLSNLLLELGISKFVPATAADYKGAEAMLKDFYGYQ